MLQEARLVLNNLRQDFVDRGRHEHVVHLDAGLALGGELSRLDHHEQGDEERHVDIRGLEDAKATPADLCTDLIKAVSAVVVALDVTPAPEEPECGYGQDYRGAGLRDPVNLVEDPHVVLDMLEYVDSDHDV